MSVVVSRELTFESAEFTDRLARTKEAMQEQGLDVIVVADPANMTWLTGYDNWSFYTPQATVVALEEAQPILILRGRDVSGAQFTTYLDDENIVGYPDEYVADHRLHPFEFVARWIGERVGGNVKVGAEMNAICYTPQAHDELRRALPGATFVNSDLLINWLRTRKSEAEVAVVRQAAALADVAMAKVTDTIDVGVRECDAAAVLYEALISGTPEFGGGPPIRPNMPASPKTTAPHLSWTDAPYRRGQSVNIELGGNRHNYHAGLSRTVHLGPPPAGLAKLAEVTHLGYEAALAAAQPGARCHDVAEAFTATINPHGFRKSSRIGYAIGLGYPPAVWLERTASLTIGDETVLEPNMTFHFMIGMQENESGYVFSETVAITDAGPQPLSQFPRELVEK